jgi:hypothetical protein
VPSFYKVHDLFLTTTLSGRDYHHHYFIGEKIEGDSKMAARGRKQKVSLL